MAKVARDLISETLGDLRPMGFTRGGIHHSEAARLP
ncbi:MAG: hypothetical protein JWN12_638 [Candidatus Saccharibacteria bacterium]|nr:hypothetical protein [Candidatus Saccharibacteria bacterium]